MASSPSGESVDSEIEAPPNRSGAGQAEATQQRIIRLACQPCRQRKIGCDRKIPCSSCCKAGLPCKYEPRKRSAIKAQRIHITSEYEEKIDTIQEQTNQIVKLLSRLTTSNASSPDSFPKTAMNPQQSRAISEPDGTPLPCSTSSVGISSQAQFEGESSLSAHTAFANSLIERAVSTAPLETFSPEMAATLDALRRLVEAQNRESNGHETTYRLARLNPNPVLPLDQNPMPPIQSVMGVMQVMKTNPQFENVGFHMYMKAEVFVGYIRKVYFPGGGFSAADFIIVNGGLIDVFLRSILLEEDVLKQETLRQHMDMCAANLETALSLLPIHMPNTMDYCLALLIGVNHCMKSSKSSAAWSLVTTALQMCISAGYHRATSGKNDTPLLREQKSWIFWSLYSAEKGLSLRLGRSSSVSDYDITLPLPGLDKADCKPYYACTIRWIKLSGIQGRVYQMLYCPAALSEPQASRTGWAQSLAAETRNLYSGEMGYDDNSTTNSLWRTTGGQQKELVFFSEDVLFLSILTLILKALPPDDGSSTIFAAECINTARLGLEKHQRFTETIGLDNGHHIDIYVNWTILYNPFMPFIVVFCHVIEVGDPSDLARLDGFVKSLDSAQHHSEATAKMYRQSKLLYEAAVQYTEIMAAKSTVPQDNSLEEFDAYIQSLGMPPLGALGNPGSETLFYDLGTDQDMDMLQSVPDMSLGRI